MRRCKSSVLLQPTTTRSIAALAGHTFHPGSSINPQPSLHRTHYTAGWILQGVVVAAVAPLNYEPCAGSLLFRGPSVRDDAF